MSSVNDLIGAVVAKHEQAPESLGSSKFLNDLAAEVGQDVALALSNDIRVEDGDGSGVISAGEDYVSFAGPKQVIEGNKAKLVYHLSLRQGETTTFFEIAPGQLHDPLLLAVGALRGTITGASYRTAVEKILSDAEAAKAAPVEPKV